MLRDARASRAAAALIVGVAVIWLGASCSQDARAQERPADQQTDWSDEAQNIAQDHEAQSETRSPGIAVPESGETHGHTAKDQREGDSPQGDWFQDFFYDIRITDALLVAFTGVLALFTYRLWHATAGLWLSAKEANRLSLENMNASRRAWVSIESVKLKHPTAFTEASVVFGIDVTVKNLGKTPATSVEIMLESHFEPGGKFLDAERRFKTKLRGHRVELGHLMFPKDIYRQGTIWADGNEKIHGHIFTTPSGERLIGFDMFVGVSYRIVGDHEAHITYHAHEMLNVPIGTAIPEGKFVDLPRTPFLAGEAD